MGKFYLEDPTLERKDEAIEYMEELFEFKSDTDGTGHLRRYMNDYEGWLNMLKDESSANVTENTVPTKTYFLIRHDDNKIVGMINIRLALNEKLKKFGGNIGYGIRPTERGKGYNKINLYLGIKKCQEYGLSEIFLDAFENNPASWKTMESLGANMVKKFVFDKENNLIMKDYIIDIDKALETYTDDYERFIYNDDKKSDKR